MKKSRRAGQSLIEFTLVGIPLIFVLVSIFEVSRGMWIYQTLAYAAKDGTRFASAHGFNCVTTAQNTNTCATSIAAIAQQVRFLSVGLDPTKTTLIFTPGTASATPTSCILSTTCAALTGQWPPDGLNAVGTPIQIDVKTPFNSAIAMLWPGSSPVRFAGGTLGASSLDYIQF